ncbi:acyltransferase [Novosphingobium album (ex Liu et al. 2023)]|nr:acyltransferase [Novosphingobium album (ex Liu et al. 2023)]
MGNMSLKQRVIAGLNSVAVLRWQVPARLVFALQGWAWPKQLKILGPIVLRGHGTLVLGTRVKIVSLSRYNPAGVNHPTVLTVLKGARMTIGDRVGMSGAAIFCATGIKIGNDVQIGANVSIFDTDFHALDYVDRRLDRHTPTAPVHIGDDVWIGANSIVLKGVTIGERAVIAAGSVVTSNIPANTLAGGVPSKVIRSLSPTTQEHVEP